MISQGNDGLSRGELATGVMQGNKFLDILPLNESAFQRCPTLKRTIWTWKRSATLAFSQHSGLVRHRFNTR